MSGSRDEEEGRVRYSRLAIGKEEEESGSVKACGVLRRAMRSDNALSIGMTQGDVR